MMFSSYRILLASLSLALVLCNHDVVAQEVQGVKEVQSSSPQRRELWDALSFLSMIMKKLGPACTGPKGLQGAKCHETDTSSASNTNANSASSSSSSSSNSVNAASQADYSASGNGGAADEYQDQQTANGGSAAVVTSRLNMWLFATVGSVIAALGAIHIGQKKNPNSARGRHEMTGVISRRATVVSAFANGLMPSKETPLADQGVEVSPGLSLDYSPSGEVEMQPGYTMV